MRKTERLLYILSLLRTNHHLKASDLAGKCDVTERTIFRDIISISAANIPIYFDGGYKLLHNGFLPPSNLTEYETGFLLGLLKSPMLGKGQPFDKTTRVIIDKIESANRDVNFKKSINIGLKQTESGDSSKAVSKIEKAIQESKIITIQYLSLKGEDSTREIAPYVLTFRNHAWYMIGHCYLRDEIRTFRLGRIGKITIKAKTFSKPDNFNIEDYFRSSWGLYRGKIKKYKVVFKNEAAVLIKTSKHHEHESKTELDDGSVMYEVSIGGEDDFIRWVMAFGNNAQIIAPESARKKVMEILSATLDNYQSQDN
jgi:predicted DNA-binding transcriptional regulator YafY